MQIKRPSLIKPTLQTPFHIDFGWWQDNDRDWHVYLRGLLCEEHQAAYAEMPENQWLDWIDPDTAEVRQVDGLQHAIMSHCAKRAGFLDEHTALVDAVFRQFLANGNTPLSAEELGSVLNRPADIILRTLSGTVVYKGLRPLMLS
jgi:hypothetical protein